VIINIQSQNAGGARCISTSPANPRRGDEYAIVLHEPRTLALNASSLQSLLPDAIYIAYGLASPRPPAPRPVGFVEPCNPTVSEQPPSRPNWIHEIKHDGFRMIVRREGEQVRLFTRHGFDRTRKYPIILEALKSLKADSPTIGKAQAKLEKLLARTEGMRFVESKAAGRFVVPLSRAAARAVGVERSASRATSRT
jgi:hypothetical protein